MKLGPPHDEEERMKEEECLIAEDVPTAEKSDLSARCQRRWFCIHRRSGRASGSAAKNN
jgi:hypothetical protein